MDFGTKYYFTEYKTFNKFLKQFIKVIKNKKIIGFYRGCDFVTMTSTISAIVGMILAINNHIITAVSCLILSGICDAFDGVLARRRENTNCTFG